MSDSVSVEPNVGNVLSILEKALTFLPPQDEKPRNPRKKGIKAPDFFPTVPINLKGENELASKFDNETLFFLFFYMAYTEEQLIASEVLKDREWRFHKVMKTWVKRKGNPKERGELYEVGTYTYFDPKEWVLKEMIDFRLTFTDLENT